MALSLITLLRRLSLRVCFHGNAIILMIDLYARREIESAAW